MKKWFNKIFKTSKKRNIMLESCFYDSNKAQQEFEEYKRKTGLSTMEITCGIPPKKDN